MGVMIVTLAAALTRVPAAVELAVITTTRLGAEVMGGAVKVAASPLAV
jgi:hypothetical protein